MDQWNAKAQPYNLLTNSCQTFARKFVEFICVGQCEFPHQGGFVAAGTGGGGHVAVGTGDLVQYRPNDHVRAMVGNANAEARFETENGVRIRAGAQVTSAAAQIDLTTTGNSFVDNNLRLRGELPAARAGLRAELESGWVAASAGFHFIELSAGPFAARAGVKLGGGLENGIPVVHAGPISTPCSLM
jgi:hypothetical protein